MNLGDTIEKITTAAGIKPCSGCNKAKALANQGEYLRALALIPSNVVEVLKAGKQPTAKVGQPFRINLSAEIVSGEVPGLSLRGFVLQGTPTTAGTFTLKLQNGPVEFTQIIDVEA